MRRARGVLLPVCPARRAAPLLLATAAAAALVTCILPRNFEATLVVRKDRTYSFTYRGLLTVLPIKAARALGQPPDADEDEIVADLKREFAANPRQFKKAVYLGEGDFDLVYEAEGRLDGDRSIGEQDMPLVTFVLKPGGRVLVEAFGMTDELLEMVQEAGIKRIDGNLTLQTDGRLVEHNGRPAPATPGAMPKLAWRIDSPRAAGPRAVIQLGPSR